MQTEKPATELAVVGTGRDRRPSGLQLTSHRLDLLAETPLHNRAKCKMAISVPTVLILGAGSSNHAGYPIGADLLNQICDRLLHHRVHSEIAAKHSPEALEEFRVRFSRSGYRSIDTFLERNEDCSELGKLLIADRLKDCENVNALFPPQNSDWYGQLFDALRGDEPDSFRKAPLTIVTFNYDRSLEAFLHESILAHYHHCHLSRHDAAVIVKGMRILHPHGILGPYPEVPYQTDLAGVKLSDIAKELTIIHEFRNNPRPFVNSEFENANVALKDAKRVFFLGFGFHDDNIRRFQFFESGDAIAGKEIHATVMVGGRPYNELVARLRQYGLSQGYFKQGDCNSLFTHHASLT